MLDNNIDTLTADRLCPVYKKEVCCELCYETVQALDNYLKISSVPELNDIDINNAKTQCHKCKHYSTWDESF